MIYTTESFADFESGQMEIQGLDQVNGYALRGETSNIIVENSGMHVHFSWIANGVGYPPSVIRWTNNRNLDYVINLNNYVVHSVARSRNSVVRDRILMQSLKENKLIILFLPDDVKLNPTRVKGLKLVH